MDQDTSKRFKYWQTRTIIATMVGYALFYFVRKNFSLAMPGMETDGHYKNQPGAFSYVERSGLRFVPFCERNTGRQDECPLLYGNRPCIVCFGEFCIRFCRIRVRNVTGMGYRQKPDAGDDSFHGGYVGLEWFLAGDGFSSLCPVAHTLDSP